MLVVPQGFLVQPAGHHRHCAPAAAVCAKAHSSRLHAAASETSTGTSVPAKESAHKQAGHTAGVPDWDALSPRMPASALSNGYTLRPGQKPASTMDRVLPTSEAGTTKKDVLLYRDTDGWCPFCEAVLFALEEKDLDYDTMLIALRNKPAWYKRKVPTELVPAALIRQPDGSMRTVWESFDILKGLEEAFPQHPLLPQDAALREEALQLAGKNTELNAVGYRFMAGGQLMTRDRKRGEIEPQQLQEAQDAFLDKLAEVEQLLGKHTSGPFFMGEFSLVDITWVPSLERLAANLPVLRHVSLRDEQRYPALSAWYAAMNQRPAYQKVKSDDWTHNLIARKLFSIAGAADPHSEDTQAAREEAALKIRSNRRAIIDDILKGSGILRGRCNLYGGTLGSVNGYPSTATFPQQEAVEFALRRVCLYLITGQTGEPHQHLEANALGSAALAFFHNRASSPRDLSAAAAEQLRKACLRILTTMF